jgi:hypothetical protein
VIGFFSFSDVTDPSAHEAYNRWHQLDHLPEQHTIDGILFGQRWVASPACLEARVAVSGPLEPCRYMTLYLMRDREVLAPFAALATELRRAGRFFEQRRSLLSGAFSVTGRWVSPRVGVSTAALPFRPSLGVYVVVGPQLDGAGLAGLEGVAGAWGFTDEDADRHITVAFVDGDLLATASEAGRWCLESGRELEWAGPLAGIDANSWDWFDRLTPT